METTEFDEKKEIELPSNIRLWNNKYQVRVQVNNSLKCKSFKTLEGAIIFKKNYLVQAQEENNRLHYLKPITYNSEGIAYISVKYKKDNKEYLLFIVYQLNKLTV